MMIKDREAYNAYMAEYMLKRYYKRRNQAILDKGSVCIDCGSDEGLEFDHNDAKSKTFDIGKLFSTASNKKLAEELEKCVLRCKKCHLKKSIKSGDISTVGHGEGVSGKRNCRCELCAPLKNAYIREHKRKKKEQAKLLGL